MPRGLGEGPYEIPNMFSFFPPEFSPPGPVSKAALVSTCRNIAIQGKRVKHFS